MLQLLQAYTGYPTTGLQFLALPLETLLLYPSSDSVVVLNARNLEFLRALAFWEAFPRARHRNDSMRCLTIDSGLKLVVASVGSCIAAWVLSASGIHAHQVQTSWRLHSTLVLPDEQTVTALDCKSGLLAIGTRSTLSVYTLTLENDLPTWSLKWSIRTKPPARVRFSPSLMYIVTTSTHDNMVRIYSTTTGRRTQDIPHPRPVMDVVWRRPQIRDRTHIHIDDPILYTTTSDGTLRIFLPVLDAPQHMQLHVALDAASALPFSSSIEYAKSAVSSSVFPLDRDAVMTVLKSTGTGPTGDYAEDAGVDNAEDGRSRRVREIAEEGWDLFLRILADGSLVVQAVANIDRRPPTLLKQFTLLQSAPGLLPSLPPSHLYVLPSLSSSRLHTLTLITSPPLATYSLSPLPFFDARADGLTLLARGGDEDGKRHRDVSRFVRTPEGEGVAALSANGTGEVWRIGRTGRHLMRWGEWDAEPEARIDRVVVLEGGKCFITYSSSNGLLTLHTTPSPKLPVPSLISLFSLTSASSRSWASSSTLVGISEDHRILLISASLVPLPSLTLLSDTALPHPPKMIIPVDPMAWSGSYSHVSSIEHDVLLSVSEDGELAFWVPEEPSARHAMNGMFGKSHEAEYGSWRCTGKVRTSRQGFSRAACSSAKKSVLVVPTVDGEELTIWDSKMSEFSSGLEFREVLSPADPINDLDWTATPDSQSILAVGFAHRVELLCQQRMTYFDETPGWGRCWTIDVGSMFPHPINDSIWLAHGSLLISAGPFMCLYGQRRPAENTDVEESLFEYVARLNGPLEDYHPQMVLQCLLWEKVELVKKVLLKLAKHVESESDLEWQNLPVDDYFQKDEVARQMPSSQKPKYSVLFSLPETNDESDEEGFSRTTVQRLLERLEERPIPHLTPNEQASLLILVQTTLEIDEQRRALDANGLRYLISMRAFYISNHRLSTPDTPASMRSGTSSARIRPRERLRYRDIIWAYHSESQDILLSAATAACGGKMTWSDARTLGVFLWMHPGEAMKTQMEAIARNQYMAGDNRDPTACSLFYFALGKVKLVHGLWRQAAWHKEQAQMLNFLNNDFKQPRWCTAALKNAFALLSKRRFEYAAAFFLLGGSLKDAVNVCIRNLADFQLAIALARVVEQGDDGPILRNILANTVIPLAFKDGNRWLASWAFWLLHRRDLAVRILVTPLQDVAAVAGVDILEIGEPHYDDPSLALLFSQLKSRTLQTVKGTSEISGRTEFNFVLQIARVFCRMGCHVLALDLVRRWSFERPSIVKQVKQPSGPPSPISTRFALPPVLRHRSSIFIDMEPVSAAPTRSASPIQAEKINTPVVEEKLDEGDLVARKAGLGSLMKSAKQDVNVPEFDMGAFF